MQYDLLSFGIKNPLYPKAIGISTTEVQNMAKEKEIQQPEKKFRIGGVVATVWKNIQKRDDEEYEVFNTSIIRTYKDKDGNWQTTNSFALNDLPKVVAVAQEAYKFIALKDTDKECL